MAKKQNEQNPFEKMTFEQAIEKLGGIVQRIETGQVPLEESLRQYEEGMTLIQHCRTILLSAEKRIELISEKHQPVAPPTAFEQDDADDEPTDRPADPEDDSLF
jgi:exodeoxyribonuclease VII small subunit